MRRRFTKNKKKTIEKKKFFIHIYEFQFPNELNERDKG